jgi:TetR/AcrR family transcriptional regulator, transcriptional repressor for nem operon
MPTRAQTKAATRQALLHAGAELFAERGLDAPSLDDICARAGKTRGAFYVHFRDRDDFLVAVMDEVGTSYLAGVFAAGLQPTVRRFVDSIAAGEYPLMRPDGVRFHQLLDACSRSPRIRERYVRLVELAIARLGEVVAADREVRSDVAPADVAVLMLAVVVGAQTMMDLGLDVRYRDLATAVLRLLR